MEKISIKIVDMLLQQRSGGADAEIANQLRRDMIIHDPLSVMRVAIEEQNHPKEAAVVALGDLPQSAFEKAEYFKEWILWTILTQEVAFGAAVQRGQKPSLGSMISHWELTAKRRVTEQLSEQIKAR